MPSVQIYNLEATALKVFISEKWLPDNYWLFSDLVDHSQTHYTIGGTQKSESESQDELVHNFQSSKYFSMG